VVRQIAYGNYSSQSSKWVAASPLPWLSPVVLQVAVPVPVGMESGQLPESPEWKPVQGMPLHKEARMAQRRARRVLRYCMRLLLAGTRRSELVPEH